MLVRLTLANKGNLLTYLVTCVQHALSARHVNVVSTKIVDPYVHLLGENSACIAYTRTTQFHARFINC